MYGLYIGLVRMENFLFFYDVLFGILWIIDDCR